MIVMIKAWLLSLLEKCVSEYASALLKKAKTEGYLSVLKELINKIKKGIKIMINFKFNLQNHSEETTTAETTVTDAVTTATEALETAVEEAAETVSTTLTTTATSTATIVTDAVTEVTTSASEGITNEIARLAKEIQTTKSIFVKIRNTVEIGVLSALLTKAASKLASKL